MANDEAERKRIFFEQLYSIDDDPEMEEEDSDTSVREFLKRCQRPAHRSATSSQRSSAASSPREVEIQAVRTPAVPFKVPELARSRSAPTSAARSTSVVKDTPILLRQRQHFNFIQKGTPLAQEVSFVEETPLPSHNPQPARRFSSPTSVRKPVIQPAGSSSMVSKRKREEPLAMVPEDKRIFKGLNFFYIPRDITAQIRKIRLKKAREHGANWARTYDWEVTHIIAEKHLTYEDIAKDLMFTSIPQVLIVNEDYPPECISSRRLLNPKSKRYLITGYQQALDMQMGPPALPSAPEKSGKPSELSLKLTEGTSITQSSSEESSQIHDSPDAKTDPSLPQKPPIMTTGNTELDEIIQRTKKLENFLAVLDEDDGQSRSGSEEQDDDSDGYCSPEEGPKPPRKKKKYSDDVPWQDNFSCMKGGTGERNTGNPNTHTIDILQEMADYYDRISDQWRSRSYRKAITVLNKSMQKISTYEEAIALPFIGPRLATKIEEIARTNRLRRLDNVKLEPTDLVLQKFLDIYGVGHSQASKWIAQGYRTLDDLLTKTQLTPNQKLGIERYEDFRTRIPREEVTALGDIIKATAKDIDPEVNITIGGSYRRGAKDSGDIDLLITKPNATVSSLHPFLDALVSKLTTQNFLVAALAVSRSESGSKWHGCCVLPTTQSSPPIWRRIDFLLVADCELGAALIYFTGNDIFNRSIRLLASRKKMRLNQRGLYEDVLRREGREKMSEGRLLEGRDERKIFEILGVPWRKPEDRIC